MMTLNNWKSGNSWDHCGRRHLAEERYCGYCGTPRSQSSSQDSVVEPNSDLTEKKAVSTDPLARTEPDAWEGTTNKTYFMLEAGKILDIRGHRWNAHPLPRYTITLEDKDFFCVYYKGLFGNTQKIYWARIGNLEFGYGLVAEHTGGGFVGGGFGLRGAIRGAATAAALNALTTRRHEYTVLMVIEHDKSGAEKTISFGFPIRNIDEATLRNEWAKAVLACTDPIVKNMENTLETSLKSGKYKKNEVIFLLDYLKKRLEWGNLSLEQADRLFVFMRKMIPEAFLED